MEEIKKHVGNEADLVHKLLIDKVPMNTVHLGLIYRLFPEAKVIFSLRNCADVVLSCFMQKFGLNNTMANFLDLKSTANLYNKTMELFELYQNTLQLQIISVRYENLIVDTEYELKVLFDFLELPWEEGVLNYRQNSFGAEINTPSYAAVSEKLYSSSRERWKNYEKQLQPVLPIIQPWLEKFGYSEESS